MSAMPEPDFTITRHDPAARQHPTTALLVIEVSNSSLRRDRKIKREIYAEAKVPEYWIVDVSKDDDLTVEVYTKPEGSTYTQVEVLRDGDVLRALHAPIVIPVADLPR
ncbi:MAG TPA: Uma2 family endonuclease [Kofleriaceae bacterium]|nr:Uma2 family endonuclease [Kofleriaceae bacterium]